jgi:ribosomal protein S18 acetylase RimI-like enzyme
MKIRKAVLADAGGIAKVHVDSWRTTYASIVPEEYLNNLTYKRREQLWKYNIPKGAVFVAVNKENDIVGFSSGGGERDGGYPGYSGELYAIYILKEYQRKGLGKLLVKPIIEDLQQKSISTMLVKVLEDNDSCHFYEALGAKKIDTVEEEISGKKLNECVYGWDDIRGIV